MNEAHCERCILEGFGIDVWDCVGVADHFHVGLEAGELHLAVDLGERAAQPYISRREDDNREKNQNAQSAERPPPAKSPAPGLQAETTPAFTLFRHDLASFLEAAQDAGAVLIESGRGLAAGRVIEGR